MAEMSFALIAGFYYSWNLENEPEHMAIFVIWRKSLVESLNNSLYVLLLRSHLEQRRVLSLK